MIRARLVRVHAIAAVVFAVAITIALTWRARDVESAVATAAFALAILVVVTVVQYRRGYAREHAMWRAYRLTVGPESVRRVTSRLLPAEVRREEVVAIVEHPGRGLTVRSADPYRFVFVPAQLERYEEARAALAQWRSIEPGTSTAVLRSLGVALIPGLVFAGSVFVPDARIAIVLGAIALVMLVWVARALLRNAHVPIEQRLFATAYLGLWGLALVLRMAFALYVVTIGA